MIDARFVAQCFMRRWWLILLCTVLAAAAGGVWAEEPEVAEEPAATYVAEATIYVNDYKSAEVNEYNYALNETLLISDARHIVLSNSVAGEVRRKYGEGVRISTPFWVDTNTDLDYASHFIFVDAIAESEQVALDAADMAVDLAVEKMSEQIGFETVEVYEPAVLKSVVGRAADFGADGLDPSSVVKVPQFANAQKGSVEDNGTGSAAKTILVSGFCAFALSFALVVAYYYINRRFRNASDVERILGVPLLGVADKDSISVDLKEALTPLLLDEICQRNDAKRVLACGLPQDNCVDEVSALLKECCSVLVLGTFRLSNAAQDRALLEDADGMVLVILQNAANARQITQMTHMLNLLQVPVAGAIFIRNK